MFLGSQAVDGQQTEAEYGQESGRENDEEMEIKNRDVDSSGMLMKTSLFWIKCFSNWLCIQ